MSKSKEAKAYHDYLAAFDCIACGDSPVHIHHVRHLDGDLVVRNHFLCLPLCPSCHQGKGSIHDNAKLFRMVWGTEAELLAKLTEKMWGDL